MKVFRSRLPSANTPPWRACWCSTGRSWPACPAPASRHQPAERGQLGKACIVLHDEQDVGRTFFSPLRFGPRRFGDTERPSDDTGKCDFGFVFFECHKKPPFKLAESNQWQVAKASDEGRVSSDKNRKQLLFPPPHSTLIPRHSSLLLLPRRSHPKLA